MDREPSVDKKGMSKRITRRDALRLMGLTTGAVAAGPALAACGSDGGQGGTQGSGQVTLEFWHTFSGAEIELLNEMVAEYTEQNPNVNVEPLNIPQDQRGTRIPQAVETNSLPDVVRADYPFQYFLAGRDKLVNLDEHLEDWPMREAIYDITWEEVTIDGNIVGIPQDKFTDVFTYNQDMFQADGVEGFPNTWDELVEACQKMTHDGQYGIGWSEIDLFYPLFLQAGGTMVDENGEVNFNSEAGTTALQFMNDLVNEYEVAPPGVGSWGYSEANNALKGGTIAMSPFGSWIIANYRRSEVPWSLGIGKMPEGPEGRGANTATTMYMVPNTSERQEEAIKLIKWLVNEENALRWAKTLDHEPIDERTAQAPHFQSPLFEPFQESLEFATVQPPIPNFEAITTQLQTAVERVLVQGATPQEALDAAAANVEL